MSRIYYSSDKPTYPIEGDVWIHAYTLIAYEYKGLSWVELGPYPNILITDSGEVVYQEDEAAAAYERAMKSV